MDLFRFTLTNSIAGSMVISDPIGWDDATIKLERDEVYHSLVEDYDQPLGFYGSDNNANGGLAFIKSIEDSQGPDAQIEILIEISEDDGDTYTTLFDGLLDVESFKEMDFGADYQLESGIIRNDFWQKFINRKDTPIDLSSSTDLDGNARTPIFPFALTLPSQKMRTKYLGKFYDTNGLSDNILYTLPNVFFATFNFEINEIDEIETRYTIPNSVSSDIYGNAPVPVLFAVKYSGTYAIDVKVVLADAVTHLDPIAAGIDMFLQYGQSEVALTRTDTAFNSQYTYAGTLELTENVEIRLIAINNNGITQSFVWYESSSEDSDSSYLSIIADTVFNNVSSVETFRIHEAGNAITDRLIGRNGTFVSEYLGRTDTQLQSYTGIGCGADYGLNRGLNARGFSLAEKPFFMSWETYWGGINAILNLGLGYEEYNGQEVLRIEPKSEFYNPEIILYLDYVNFIERSYANEFIFKTIEIGYEKWSAESLSGIDDPQTKRTYNTKFKTIGKDEKILSKFVAASLAIEQTRRQKLEIGKDWKLDEEVFIIALRQDDPTTVELDELFDSITGLLSPETRINSRITAARNFFRWLDYFQGCLQTGDVFSFAKGDGNFDMTSQLAIGCSGETTDLVSEKGNITNTEDILFYPTVLDFEHPLTFSQYLTIRNNRKNAIGISRTASDHMTCHIKLVEYQITHKKAKFTVFLGKPFEAESIELHLGLFLITSGELPSVIKNINIFVTYTGIWSMGISEAIGTNLVFGNISANGSNDSCSTTNGETDFLANTTITAGNTSNTYTNPFPLTGASTYYSVEGTMDINGVPRSNGDSWIQGIYIFNLVISPTNCSSFM